MHRPLLLALAVVSAMTVSSPAFAGEPLHVYGPGGPFPAMKEAAAVFERAHGVQVKVVAGPPPQWVDEAKAGADLIFSGSEYMLSDFIAEMPDIDPASARALYLRPAAILVHPGNPEHIMGVADLLNPGHRILVVDGAGQQGLWEDVALRLGQSAHHRSRQRPRRPPSRAVDREFQPAVTNPATPLASSPSRPARWSTKSSIV